MLCHCSRVSSLGNQSSGTLSSIRHTWRLALSQLNQSTALIGNRSVQTGVIKYRAARSLNSGGRSAVVCRTATPNGNSSVPVRPGRSEERPGQHGIKCRIKGGNLPAECCRQGVLLRLMARLQREKVMASARKSGSISSEKIRIRKATQLPESLAVLV